MGARHTRAADGDPGTAVSDPNNKESPKVRDRSSFFGFRTKFLRSWALLAAPLMRRATSICVPSEFLQQIFGEYKLASTLLPNIAQTEMFSWKKREGLAPSLLVTRHLDPMYNIECLLRAFRIIKAHFPEAKLSVAGDGSEAKRLQELVAKWKLAGVKFL